MKTELVKHMDLYGNVSYKKQLWSHLWDNKHKASVNAERHDSSYRILNRLQSFLKFASNSLVGVGVFVLGISDENAKTAVIVLNIAAIVIQVVEATSNLERNKLEHKQSSEKYKDICGEIDRIMSIKRTGAQFTEVLDTISTRITNVNRGAPHVMSFIEKKYELHIPDIPLVPISPEVSVNIPSDRPDKHEYFLWNVNYPILSSDPICEKYYRDVNNIAHYMNDTSGYVSQVDENCCYFVGMSQEDVISPSGFGWVTKIYREDIDYIMDRWKLAVATKDRFLEKYRFVHPNNAMVYVVAEAYPKLSKMNDFLGMEGILLNVPEDTWNKIDLEIYRDTSE